MDDAWTAPSITWQERTPTKNCLQCAKQLPRNASDVSFCSRSCIDRFAEEIVNNHVDQHIRMDGLKGGL